MATSTSMVRQAGVLAVRGGQLCLVTSRGGKRWVIPKGNLETGKTAAEIALQEAWEEAGLVGALQPDPIGSYLYEKAGATCHVTVFLLSVTETADDWPERELRQRNWLAAAQAMQRLEDASLRELIREAMDCPTK